MTQTFSLASIVAPSFGGKKGRSTVASLAPLQFHVFGLPVITFGASVIHEYFAPANVNTMWPILSFKALGEGGCENRTWIYPKPPSMLTLHCKAYHRIFDLQE